MRRCTNFILTAYFTVAWLGLLLPPTGSTLLLCVRSSGLPLCFHLLRAIQMRAHNALLCLRCCQPTCMPLRPLQVMIWKCSFQVDGVIPEMGSLQQLLRRLLGAPDMGSTAAARSAPAEHAFYPSLESKTANVAHEAKTTPMTAAAAAAAGAGAET